MVLSALAATAPTSWSRRNDARPVSCDEMGRNRRKRYCFQDNKEGAGRPLLSFNIECLNQSRNDVSRVIAKVLQRSLPFTRVKFVKRTRPFCQVDCRVRLSLLHQHLDGLVAYLDDCHRTRQTRSVQRCNASGCNDRVKLYAICAIEYNLCACFCSFHGDGVALCLYQDRTACTSAMASSSVSGTIVPKLIQGEAVLYCSMDAAGTWSVAFHMFE